MISLPANTIVFLVTGNSGARIILKLKENARAESDFSRATVNQATTINATQRRTKLERVLRVRKHLR